MTHEFGGKRNASQILNMWGYDGIKYPAEALSGGDGTKGWNYVVFSQKQIKIIKKEEV
jgi:hypothetical protein